jgi:hypothetical protein
MTSRASFQELTPVLRKKITNSAIRARKYASELLRVSGQNKPSGGLLRSATIALYEITVAALSGASSHYDVAHGTDCDRCWRRARSILGRVDAVAGGDRVGALAFVRGPLGGDMVPQLTPASPFRCACRAGCGSPWGLVRWWHRSNDWHGSDRDGAGWVPAGALAGLVARAARLRRH